MKPVKNPSFLLLLLACCIVDALAQQPIIQWTTRVSGEWQKAHDAVQTADGGFIATGDGSQHLTRLNAAGGILWTTTLPGYAGWDVIQTNDEGFAVGTSCCAVKVDANGGVIWSYPTVTYDGLYALHELPDGGLIGCGRYNDANGWAGYLIRLTSDGTLLWDLLIGPSAYSDAQDLWPTSEGGVIVARVLGYDDGRDVALTKVSGLGVIEWEHTYGGNMLDEVYAVRETADGGFAFCGASRSFSMSPDASDPYITKVDESGNVIWIYAPEMAGGQLLQSLLETPDGGFVATGVTEPNGWDSNDILVLRVSAGGNLLWNWTFGTEDAFDAAWDIVRTTDGGYFISAGSAPDLASSSDWYLVKTSADQSCLYPQTPENLIVTTSGQDAALTWLPVTETIDHCPITPDLYLIFFSQYGEGPFYYLDYVDGQELSYQHRGVVRHSPSMHYFVTAFRGPTEVITQLPRNAMITMNDIEQGSVR